MASEVDTDASNEPVPWYGKHGSWRYRALDWVGRRTKGRIPRPFARSSLKFHLARDAQENEDATPPLNEKVQVLGLWVFDAFVPSNIGQLQRTFRANGWHRENVAAGQRDVASWLSDMRRTGSVGSHYMYLVRPEAKGFGMLGSRVKLPSFAERAQARLTCITPSISYVSIFFVFKADHQSVLESALRRYYRTWIEPKGEAISPVTPDWGRKRAVSQIRRQWRSEVGRWLRGHFPGLFSTTGDDCDLATCELLITEEAHLFSDAGVRTKTAEMIDANFSMYTFDEPSVPSLVFAEARGDDDLGNHRILALERSQAQKIIQESRDDKDEHHLLHRINERFQRPWRVWSLLDILHFYEKQTNSARASAVQTLEAQWPFSALKRLRHLFAVLADVPVVSRELCDLAASGRLNAIDGFNLKLRRWRAEEDGPSIGTIVKDNIEKRAARLAQADGELRNFINSQGSLISANANLWLQVAAIIFAVASLIFGAVSAYDVVLRLTS